jgi:hypothetical protein
VKYIQITFHASAWDRMLSAIEHEVLFESLLRFIRGKFSQIQNTRLENTAGLLVMEAFERSNVSLLKQVVVMSEYFYHHSNSRAREYFTKRHGLKNNYYINWLASIQYGYSSPRDYNRGVARDVAMLFSRPEKVGLVDKDGNTDPEVRSRVIYNLGQFSGEETKVLEKLAHFVVFASEAGKDDLYRMENYLDNSKFTSLISKTVRLADMNDRDKLAKELREENTRVLVGTAVA